MEIVTSKWALSKAIQAKKNPDNTVGFVPTMGALHAGHLSLIERAKEISDIVVCSIFVNPTQFNNPQDLEKYPRPVKSDVELLRSSGCHVVFLPEVSEMYSEGESWKIDLGYLEQILEGEFRPGHYQGVTQIVKKLLDAVKPDFLLLGQKDFQQVMVIDKMLKMLSLPVKIEICPIARDDDGLALSSRNIHLSEKERFQALVLSQLLFESRENFNQKSLMQLKSDAWKKLKSAPGLVPEYFEICDSETLLPADSVQSEHIVALVAAKVGHTRLIDNIILK